MGGICQLLRLLEFSLHIYLPLVHALKKSMKKHARVH